jgi:hypothetical protein
MKYVDRRIAEIRAAMEAARPPVVEEPPAPRTRLHGTRLGYIYFAMTEDFETVKIGWTAHIHQRMRNIQTGNAQKVTLEKFFPTYIEAEKMIHNRFKADRLNGEWFRNSEDMGEFWDDIWDYQHFIASRKFQDGEEIFSRIETIVVDLDGLDTMLKTINERWPPIFVANLMSHELAAGHPVYAG